MRSPDNPDPVHKAVMRHSLTELIEAISSGAAVDALDREGRTALFYAASEGEIDLVTELIRNGANVNVQDKNQETALHFSAREYQVEVAQILLKSGAKVDIQDAHGNSPLGRAVFGSRNRGEMIKLLLSYGADKNQKNKHGVSPDELADTIANYEIGSFLR